MFVGQGFPDAPLDGQRTGLAMRLQERDPQLAALRGTGRFGGRDRIWAGQSEAG